MQDQRNIRTQTMSDKKLYVYLNQDNNDILIGYLWSHIKGISESASFQYAESWLEYPNAFAIDPSLYLTSGQQYTSKPLFGAFTDCAPDRWGRLLMTRFEQNTAKEENRTPRKLNDIDYLTRVNDEARQGALRFKYQPDGDFIFPADLKPIPPLIKLPELLSASEKITENSETSQDFKLLLAPGSSLGGARPKASVIDNDGDLCIAKFPKKDDSGNIVLWEAVALNLAKQAGLNVPTWKVVNVLDKPVLLIKRFDRIKNKRIPFISAMTMLSATDGDHNFSYQNIADIIRQHSSEPEKDLTELWRRIIFSILISNTDDHLRNHGFLRLDNHGWRLSPVYDVNPNPDNTSMLSTAICEGVYETSLENALSVAEYFNLSQEKAKKIINEVQFATSQWKRIAHQLGLSSEEIHSMEMVFKS